MKLVLAAVSLCVGACSAEPLAPEQPATPLEVGASVSDWQATSQAERVRLMRTFASGLLPSARPEQLQQAAEDLERCVDRNVMTEAGSAPVAPIAYGCESLLGLR